MQQQLQNQYRGDGSETLAQILGMDYNPQNFMAQMAQQMLSTGMGSSTQLKAKAMEGNYQSNRDFLQRQYEMNKARNEQSELRNAATAGLRGRQAGILGSLGTYMGMLDPNDPFAQEEALAMQNQISGLENMFSEGGSLAERAATLQAIMDAGLNEPTVAGGAVLLKRKGEAYRRMQESQAKKPEEAKQPEESEDPNNSEYDLGN